MLLPVDEKDMQEAVGLFCVGKDAQNDRLIINPTAINSRMHCISKSTKELAPGCLLGLLHLEPSEIFRFQADDLSDYYYTIVVSSARAARNAIRMQFHWEELSHFKCFSDELIGKDLLICLRTLAMGDNLAVEVAQQAHSNLLRDLVGSLLPHQTLKYRSPIPRTSFIEMIAIDDHVGIQKLTYDQYRENLPLRDAEVFDKAARAYKQVKLIQHEHKRKRNQTAGVILGADFDGIQGIVMAPRSRLALLILITSELACRGTCTPRLLSVVLGCWIHALLFRRVLFAILHEVFKQGSGLPQDAVFRLSPQARNELLLICALGPSAQSNLRAKYSDHVFCTDASPWGGAVIRAQVGAAVSEELWRHTEQKGFTLDCRAQFLQL